MNFFPRSATTAVRKSPAMASKLSIASRLLPRLIEIAAERPDVATTRMHPIVALAAHRLRASAPLISLSDTTPSAVSPIPRNAHCAHGASEPTTHGVKLNAATRVDAGSRKRRL